jgi:hypothetical protein
MLRQARLGRLRMQETPEAVASGVFLELEARER